MGRAYQNRKASMAKTADAKTKIYGKFGREIYVCAKTGGSDTDGNLALRGLIERAKKSQVPTHVIEKAVAKAQGGGGEDFTLARYEGYGPGNIMIIIDCLTDNPNRTFGDVRLCFTKVDCKIGTQGSVSHMFDHSAVLSYKGEDEDAALEALMIADVDVSDIEVEEGFVTVLAPNTEYAKAKNALVDAFGEIDFEIDEIQFVPKISTHIEGENLEQFNKFLDLLDDLDDVQKFYYDAEL
jgi:YebC/PmpR family DNA-binding regulatory protein